MRLLCTAVSSGRSRSVKKRSGYQAFCCAMACKKKVPAFFKVLLYSDVQKVSPKSGGL